MRLKFRSPLVFSLWWIFVLKRRRIVLLTKQQCGKNTCRLLQQLPVSVCTAVDFSSSTFSAFCWLMLSNHQLNISWSFQMNSPPIQGNLHVEIVEEVVRFFFRGSLKLLLEIRKRGIYEVTCIDGNWHWANVIKTTHKCVFLNAVFQLPLR